MMDMEGLDLPSYLVPRYAIPLPLTRGCHWHRCNFCNISNQARERYRHRNTELALADIQTLIRRYEIDWFDFPTDSFRCSDLVQLAQSLVDSKSNIRWAAEVFIDHHLSDDFIRLLADSGCCGLRFGLESASPKTLAQMDKHIRPKEASRIFRSCHKYGIMTGVMVIIGYPTETQSELLVTVDFLRENAEYIDFLTLHQFTVSPGSRLAAHPELAGIYLLPRQAVLTPSLPYSHTNPVAMRPQDLAGVISSLRDSLSDLFPQMGQLWASGIGGWLTFAVSCNNEPDFLKRPLP